MTDQSPTLRYFAVLARDRAGVAELRQQLRPEHRAWLRAPGAHRVCVRLGGPLLDAHGNMNGTLLVVEAASEKEVRDFITEDPYTRANLFEQLEIMAWQWSLGQPQSQLQETA
jgi:uncharacterized protein YciI